MNRTAFFGVIFLVLAGSACGPGRGKLMSPRPQVLIGTEFGDILIEVYPDKAPVTAENFLSYVDGSRFENASFYRVVTVRNQPDNPVKIEVIQGGLGPEESDKELEPIRHETTEETGIKHKDGVISMARLEPGTAASEFFICVGDQPELDFGGKRNPDGQGFAAFGRVLDGMEVVLRIHESPCADQLLEPEVRISDMHRVHRGPPTDGGGRGDGEGGDRGGPGGGKGRGPR